MHASRAYQVLRSTLSPLFLARLAPSLGLVLCQLCPAVKLKQASKSSWFRAKLPE